MHFGVSQVSEDFRIWLLLQNGNKLQGLHSSFEGTKMHGHVFYRIVSCSAALPKRFCSIDPVID